MPDSIRVKRPKKRFSTRAELITAIDDVQFKLKMAMKLANEHDAEKDRLKRELLPLAHLDYHNMTQAQRTFFHSHDMKIKQHAQESTTLTRSIPGLKGKIERLKAALGVFDTEPMPFLSDRSVQS